MPPNSPKDWIELANTWELMGYIDHTGRFVIAPQYHEALDFSEGLAAVSYNDDKSIHIDRTGKKRLNLNGGLWSFSDGLTIAGSTTKGSMWTEMGT